MSEFIKQNIIGHIAVLEICRPEALNALNKELVEELLEKAISLEANEEIYALIISGKDNFAAGADIKSMVELNQVQAKKFMFSEMFTRLENLRIPTIAAICGYALGGGFELALACDFRIASKNAQMAFPEINLGIFPGAGGAVRLPALVGVSKAKELIYLGTRITASEALEYGIVMKVVEDTDLQDEAIDFAERLCRKAPMAISAAKITIGSTVEGRGVANRVEEEQWSALFETDDQKEGMRAFSEKRKAKFKGK